MKKSVFWLVTILVYIWMSVFAVGSAGQPFFLDTAAKLKALAKNQAMFIDYYKTLAMDTSSKPDIISKRTEDSTTYLNANGTYTTEFSSTPAHYKEDYADASEFWKDIDVNHTISTPTYVEYDRMPTIVKVFKNETGYEIDSRKTGQKYLVELQDISGQKVSKAENQQLASAIFTTADAADSTTPLKFSFDVSANGVRLWKTIQGPDAPKTFTWKVTESGSGNDLQFRNIPEAYKVTNGVEHPDQQVTIQTNKQTLADNSFLWTETAPSTNLKIDTDVIFNPDPTNTVTEDGFVSSSAIPNFGESWSAIHDGTGICDSDKCPNTTSPDYFAAIGAANTGAANNWYILNRGLFLFNTATLPTGAIISGATFSTYGTAKTDGLSIAPTINVYSSNPASNTAIAAGDYATFGTTAFSTAVTYASWNTGGYNNFILNGSGLAAINPTGVTKLGLRLTTDAANVQPNWIQYQMSSFSGDFSESGLGYAPKLDITYTSTGPINSTGNVLLTGTILPFLTLTLSGATASFGNITPGNNSCANGASGTETDVTTNASNGYTLAVSDGSNTNSAMVQADGVTYIPDFTTGTVTVPAVYSGYGVGLNMYSGAQKEAKWGTGTTDCDTNYDKWAGVPSAATVAHTITGYTASTDKDYWGWIVNVANTQKTGIYSGNVLMTVTTVLN